MYRNIGRKIKGGAIAFFIILGVGTFIPGLALTLSRMEAVGIPLMLGGPVLAWISSWALYGFGELISKTSEIAYYAKYIAENSAAPISGAAPVQRPVVPPPAATPPANWQPDALLRQGLITQEEYDDAVLLCLKGEYPWHATNEGGN